MKRIAAALAVLSLVAGCASQLPRERVKKSPEGQAVEEAIDLSQIEMLQLSTAEPVNLGAYMDERNVDFMLLMFGSKGCGICTEKSIALRDQYIGSHALWSGPEARGFELIGVSTDGLEARGLVTRFALQNRFEHYRWLDPQGEAMLRWFMPAGEAVGVPFTVMLSRDGIMWRVTNSDKENGAIDVLLARALETVEAAQRGRTDDSDDGASDGGPRDGGDGDADGGGTDTDGRGDNDGDGSDDAGDDGDVLPVPDGQLVATAANRLKGTAIRSCASGEELDLHEFLGEAKYRVVQVLPKGCDASCQDSIAPLLAADQADPQIAAVTLLADEVSCTGGAFQGGQPFVDAFGTMFDWQHKVTLTPDWALELADFAAPLLFVFGEDGTLLHTEEKTQTTESLVQLFTSRTLDEPARSFNRTVYTNGRAHGFADIRLQSDYTIVLGFERFCESCQHEMASFNAPNHLLDYCAARPTTCQFFAMENTYQENFSGWEATVNDTLVNSRFFTEAGLTENRIPLMFDAGSTDGVAPGDEYLTRYYTGYLAARFPAFDKGWGGIVIYNREGRMVGKIDPVDPFAGEDPDPDAAFAYIRSLMEEN